MPSTPPLWQWPQNEDLIQNFEYSRGKTPLTSVQFVVGAVLGYPTIIFLSQFLLKSRVKSVNLGRIPALHNLVLCVGSFFMFLGALQAAIVDSEQNRWLWGAQNKYSWLLCFPPGTKAAGRIFFWSYVYYLSKFYELIDTVILVLKKKTLTLLHVYHHCLVIVMCYLWLEGQQSLQTLGLLTNTGIHVVMYFYYFMHSIGRPPPWRKFVTNSQIIQFLFSLLASIPFLWFHLYGPGCAGFWAWLFNVGFNITLLLLFADFHRKQYGRKQEVSKKAA